MRLDKVQTNTHKDFPRGVSINLHFFVNKRLEGRIDRGFKFNIRQLLGEHFHRKNLRIRINDVDDGVEILSSLGKFVFTTNRAVPFVGYLFLCSVQDMYSVISPRPAIDPQMTFSATVTSAKAAKASAEALVMTVKRVVASL